MLLTGVPFTFIIAAYNRLKSKDKNVYPCLTARFMSYYFEGSVFILTLAV